MMGLPSSIPNPFLAIFFPDSRFLEVISRNNLIIKIKYRFPDLREVDPDWMDYYDLVTQTYLKKIPSNFKLIFSQVGKKCVCCNLRLTADRLLAHSGVSFVDWLLEIIEPERPEVSRQELQNIRQGY